MVAPKTQREASVCVCVCRKKERRETAICSSWASVCWAHCRRAKECATQLGYMEISFVFLTSLPLFLHTCQHTTLADATHSNEWMPGTPSHAAQVSKRDPKKWHQANAFRIQFSGFVRFSLQFGIEQALKKATNCPSFNLASSCSTIEIKIILSDFASSARTRSARSRAINEHK